MAFPQRAVPLPAAQVVENPEIMGGWPCVAGTRIPALTIVAYIRGGASDSDIFEDYPSLPFDGIRAVRGWAEANGVSLDPDAGDVAFPD